jgi:hypothetical protein
VITRIKEIGQHKDVNIKVVRWIYESGSPSGIHVPFSLDSLQSYVSGRIDFGAIWIREGFAAPLLANSTLKPLTPGVWQDCRYAKPDGHFIIGFPECWTAMQEVDRNNGIVNFSAGAYRVCIPVERLPFDQIGEPREFWDDDTAFYGRILSVKSNKGDDLQSVKGMSGGPLFSVGRVGDGKIGYRLDGIQVKWLPQQRIIKAEPINKVVEEIQEWFERTRKSDRHVRKSVERSKPGLKSILQDKKEKRRQRFRGHRSSP